MCVALLGATSLQETVGLKEALDSGHPAIQSSVGFESVHVGSKQEVRWLPHCSMENLYDEYVGRLQAGQTPASMTTFRRVRKTWERVLRIRQLSQHARCDVCCKYDLVRDQARGMGETEKAEAAILGKKRHLAEMFADRSLEVRLNRLSELSTTSGQTIQDCRVLKLDVDGMDQAKFKVGPCIVP